MGLQALTTPEWFLAAFTAAVVASMGLAACLHMLRNHPWTARFIAKQPGGVTPMMVLLGLTWLGLFCLTVLAAYVGIWNYLYPDPANPTGSQTTFALGALIAALLGAPFVIWATVIKQTTLNFQKEGHITDRISKAVEQLGAEKTVKVPKEDSTGSVERSLPNIEVRIGGLLSLERIAQDSTRYDNGRDHVRVMEILCAYVRENAKASEAEISKREIYESETEDSRDSPGMTSDQIEEKYGFNFVDEAKNIDALKEWASALDPPREDIAIALRIIGRRGPDQLRVEAGWGNDTPNAEWVFNKACPHLPDEPGKAALATAELTAFKRKLEAWQTKIRTYKGYRPDLRNTNLQRADLSDATLSGADLQGARMEGANLSRARMEGADFSRARMDGADLSHARMDGADLSHARMDGADLSDARMEGADLSYARMEGAHLWRARMEGADLGQARMKGANLWQVKLSSADLRGWTIARTSLRSADLGDCTTLTQDGVNAAWGDGSTRLPPHITRPDHWPDTALANSWDDDPAYDAWIAAGAPPGTPRAP